MGPYRKPPSHTHPDYVQVSRDLLLRRDWIHHVFPDGTIMRIDRLAERGDPAYLREAGLL